MVIYRDETTLNHIINIAFYRDNVYRLYWKAMPTITDMHIKCSFNQPYTFSMVLYLSKSKFRRKWFEKNNPLVT